ncbi:class I SAM-dependent methyltransferase [Nocardia sp. NPDC049149]|uniref:class I SAM-dependent methyltransferase n=1 Tax=Nocardia sp. NPDC049149 TaxID=3364315 RepID=UPI0037232B2D
MQGGRPSRTALATARARAYHQIAPDPRVFTDPLAVAITGHSADELTDLSVAAIADASPTDVALQRLRRLSIAGRARFGEDTIADAVASGVRQAVILGAGLDTFAYRNPHQELRVFEVDHPSTQLWKRQLLADAGITVPDSLTFTPIDFENATLASGLAAAGFDRSQPAVFIWPGVVMYLTLDSIRATLRYIAEQATPVRLVLDYLLPFAEAAPELRAQLEVRAARVASVGEPWLSYFTTAEMAAELRAAGFDTIEDHATPEALAGYVGRAELGPQPDMLHSHLIRAGRG